MLPELFLSGYGSHKKIKEFAETRDGEYAIKISSLAKKYADYVTTRHGGDRAVAEACLHILEKFFEPYNPDILPKE